jgi:hypothetical protein
LKHLSRRLSAGMQLDLTDEETGALLNLLTGLIEGDRYPMSPRIKMLRRIRAKLPGIPPVTGDAAIVDIETAPPKARAANETPAPALTHRLAIPPGSEFELRSRNWSRRAEIPSWVSLAR